MHVTRDRAVFAYLGDVFVLPAYRGRGLGVWLVQCVLSIRERSTGELYGSHEPS